MEGLTEVRRLGSGTFGVALLVKKGSRYLVLKKVDLTKVASEGWNYQLQEVQLLKTLRHEAIVAYEGSAKVGSEIHLLMEYCDGGDLHTLIQVHKRNANHFPVHQLRRWSRSLASALQYIHRRNVLHRDLKPMNIFLTRSGEVKLGDFGLARVFSPTSFVARSMLGTYFFMAPEVLSHLPYNAKADMWALGCCIYEMAALNVAYPVMDITIPDHYGAELSNFLSALLTVDPTQRISASEALTHPFLRADEQASPGVASQGAHQEDRTMVILVKDLYGGNFTLRVTPSMTVLEVKKMLQTMQGVAPEAFSVTCGSIILRDDHTLRSYNVREGNTLQMTLKFLGGQGS
ncbi:uncharacterized protein [Panulirus ornatus]|uniref:uncharacterized protein n=1 Tax=Panulirus ornatus TaxID=150431 RepID=UPI003A864091